LFFRALRLNRIGWRLPQSALATIALCSALDGLNSAVWRVKGYTVRVREVVGSNPAAPTSNLLAYTREASNAVVLIIQRNRVFLRPKLGIP
jgi:hypothetical protein